MSVLCNKEYDDDDDELIRTRTTNVAFLGPAFRVQKGRLRDLKLCLILFFKNITGRSQRQVLFFQWQGTGPARTWRSAATAREPLRIFA